MAGWRPKLSSSAATPLYRRLFEAIAADVEAGRLATGARLPPQRELAHALAISVGAVTRAYDEAMRRGLVAAQVGRGTFVVDRERDASLPDGPIDLSINIAPTASLDAMVETVAALRRTRSWAQRLAYQPPCGLDDDRRAGAAWLSRTAGFVDLDWRMLICSSGAQNAMAIAFAALCRPADMILCEAATFSGMKALAAQQGYRLHGIEMDEGGLLPQALDRAATVTGAHVLYMLPTLQNPTTRTMSERRRADIVRIARARDILIVEDDIYAPYAKHLGLPPIATLAPERTFYVSSLSKILSPGLRVGFLVAPPGEKFDACVRAMRALMHSPAGIGAAVATEWIESGRADDLARDVRAEAHARTAMALAALKGRADEPRTATSLHLWMPMATRDAERLAAVALTAGLRLTPPRAFGVLDSKTSAGLRLCLGSAPNRKTLERALWILWSALSGHLDDHDTASSL